MDSTPFGQMTRQQQLFMLQQHHHHQQPFNPNQLLLQSRDPAFYSRGMSPQQPQQLHQQNQQNQQPQQAFDVQTAFQGYLPSNPGVGVSAGSGVGVFGRPQVARHGQGQQGQGAVPGRTQSVPLYPNTAFSTTGSSGHQTPSQDSTNPTPGHRFSRTPSPSRSSAHSPPANGTLAYSSGRVSPASFFQGTPGNSAFQDTISPIPIGGTPRHQVNVAALVNHQASQQANPESFIHANGSMSMAMDSRDSSPANGWPYPHSFHQYPQHPDQTPLSIPQTLFPGQLESAPYLLNGSQDNLSQGQFTPSPSPAQHHYHQRVGRPLSTQMSVVGTPMTAPTPSRQRVLQQGQVLTTPTFHQQPQQHQQYQHQQYQQNPQTHPHQHQLQSHHQQHQYAPPHQHQQQLYSTPLVGPTPTYQHHPRTSESEDAPAPVLKVPPGYFPIYNGNEWVMISHAAAITAGIPIPHPQNSPSHGLNGTPNSHSGFSTPQRMEGPALSHSGSPPAHVALSRQNSEAGYGSSSGVDMKRTESQSRRGSLPLGSSRAASPSDYKSTKSPTSGSPSHGGYRNESSSTVQENLDFLELLQRYEYLNTWARQGKSKTPSEAGSPIEVGSAPKRQEPFEKSLVLKEITEWIDDHKEYLLGQTPDLRLPSQIDFGNINPRATPVEKTVRIENHGSRIVQLKALKIIPNAFDQLACLSKETIFAHPADGIEPMFGNIEISLTTGANLGFFSSWLLILVNDSALIGRKITWNVTNNTQIERDMDPYAKSYTPQRLRNLNLIKPRMVITGESVDTIDFHVYLEQSEHPSYKRHNGKFSLDPPTVEPMQAILPGQISIDLSADSYASRLQPLLRVEQYLQAEDVSSYNLFMVEIKLHDASLNFFQIQVSGLAERCPPLLRGDAIIVRQVTNGVFTGIEYRTFVHGTNLRTNSIYVHLPIGALPSLSSERWNVQFKSVNGRIKEMYRAVGGVQELIGYHPPNPTLDGSSAGEEDRFYSPRSFLFPAIHDARPKSKLPGLTLDFVDPLLNWEQKATVQSIVKNDYGLVPFIINGPPGTGKTKTLTETALQILMNDTQSYILMTAPSHSACDTIMKRLIPYLKPQYLFRLNDPARTFAEVPDVIRPYCFGDVYFNMPPLDDLLRFRIVVCTCEDAGLLVSAGASNQSIREYQEHKGLAIEGEVLRSHWTHLLVDEAAQAIEPETDIALLCVLDEAEQAPQIVLCGDHQQLGPKTFLPELQLSFLERLVTTAPLYRDHPKSRRFTRSKSVPVARAKPSSDTEYLEKTLPCFANLVQNYRSHPKMLMMPSTMFYNDTLVSSAEEALTSSMLGCDVLPNPDCPIAFVGVVGQDVSQLEEAISWKNEAEAEKVVEIIDRILRQGGEDDEEAQFHVKMKDIGVIAPFREQVKTLRLLLRSKGYAAVNVGTVEDYQGQEYRIMLISTTRSRVKYLDQDVRQGLGLVHFKKRFNVALTRAQSMMVIVGNPELLVRDENWADYLHFCLRNGAYTGCPLPDSILNAHATGQTNAAHIGRLEMNTFHSQFVENLDRRRWLGPESEQEGFIVVPSESDTEQEDDEDGDDEDEDDEGCVSDEIYQDEGRYGEDEVDGLNDISGVEYLANHRADGSAKRGIKDGDEDDETHLAMEKLALGSLVMDDDTPELRSRPTVKTAMPMNNGESGSLRSMDHVGPGFAPGKGMQQQPLSSTNGTTHDAFKNKPRQAEYTAPQAQSPITWPSNDRAFKRMSNSKLVLERSFDPSEQDIFEDY